MFNALHIPYAQTGLLSRLLSDYINGENALRPFYAHRPDMDGIKSAIEIRKKYPNRRKPLHDLLSRQYDGMSKTDRVNENIDLLLNENTFTVCTAHQPNVFTGRLYFIYKIIHAIKTAAYLNRELPHYHFIPVYYMGSEDADINELGEININGENLQWKTP
ncbi:MAG: bacillithiol biosynthesis BshC, partial [Ferruginibacter sp.]|nr:bacillithiol biosynthesis BshC [Ferruginibacter sp.]